MDFNQSLEIGHSVMGRLLEAMWQKLADKALTEVMKKVIATDIFDATRQLTALGVSDIGLSKFQPISHERETTIRKPSFFKGNYVLPNQNDRRSEKQQSLNPQRRRGLSMMVQPAQTYIKLEQQHAHDATEERMRAAYHKSLLQQRESMRHEADMLVQEQEIRLARIKFKKQKKDFTYDFSGKIVNVNQKKVPSKPLVNRMQVKLLQAKAMHNRMLERNRMQTSVSQIQNPRRLVLDRKTNNSPADQQVQFSSKRQSEILEDQAVLMDGVRLLEVRDNEHRVVKENPKRLQSETTKKYTLGQFKQYYGSKGQFQQRLFRPRTTTNSPSRIRHVSVVGVAGNMSMLQADIPGNNTQNQLMKNNTVLMQQVRPSRYRSKTVSEVFQTKHNTSTLSKQLGPSGLIQDINIHIPEGNSSRMVSQNGLRDSSHRRTQSFALSQTSEKIDRRTMRLSIKSSSRANTMHINNQLQYSRHFQSAHQVPEQSKV